MKDATRFIERDFIGKHDYHVTEFRDTVSFRRGKGKKMHIARATQRKLRKLVVPLKQEEVASDEF